MPNNVLRKPLACLTMIHLTQPMQENKKQQKPNQDNNSTLTGWCSQMTHTAHRVVT